MNELYIVKLNTPIHEERLLEVVSLIRRNEILQFSLQEDRIRKLLGELLLRYILQIKKEIRLSPIKFIRNEWGKPSIDGLNGIHFNISHSYDYVVCGVSTHPFGIDVEAIREINLNIANHFFTLEEIEYIHSQIGDERFENFFQLWTRKESYVKAIGKGLTLPLNSFSVTPMNEKICDDKGTSYFIKDYQLKDRYKLAICSQSPFFSNDVHFITINDILKNLEGQYL